MALSAETAATPRHNSLHKYCKLTCYRASLCAYIPALYAKPCADISSLVIKTPLILHRYIRYINHLPRRDVLYSTAEQRPLGEINCCVLTGR